MLYGFFDYPKISISLTSFIMRLYSPDGPVVTLGVGEKRGGLILRNLYMLLNIS